MCVVFAGRVYNCTIRVKIQKFILVARMLVSSCLLGLTWLELQLARSTTVPILR